jgi:hypothetical protein
MSSPLIHQYRKSLAITAFLFLCMADSLALDRDAFSFTNYQLTVQVDPEQHRLGARGRITLRNDSQVPQKIAVLQISSSLDWRSIRAGEQAVQFVRQLYTSDIDHTGALTEAIVTLPREIATGGTIDLDIAYEGVILPDATRLMRIGTPEDVAKNTDWDQIDPNFTAVRGAGYVTWYPIATEAANLSENDNLFDVLTQWKSREAGSKMDIELQNPIVTGEETPMVVVCSGKGSQGATRESHAGHCYFDNVAHPPSFAIADFGVVNRPSVTVFNLSGRATAAEAYAGAAEKVTPIIVDWFGPLHNKLRIADLPDSHDAAFESGTLLLTPLAYSNPHGVGLTIAHQLAHVAFSSPRPWIEEGLAHFAQAVYLEQESGRQAALGYMELHRSAFAEAEKAATTAQAGDQGKGSLVDPANEDTYRDKALYVWWMLRDMIGDAALKKALALYRPEDDKDASYMPRLIATQTSRDLGWFFDDWIYHDRGLPDFKVATAFASKTSQKGYMVTVTLENLGVAGAEVPIEVKATGGQISKRLEVRAKSKVVTRIETSGTPQEIVVNDGSVPEIDVKNNTFKIEPAKE